MSHSHEYMGRTIVLNDDRFDWRIEGDDLPNRRFTSAGEAHEFLQNSTKAAINATKIKLAIPVLNHNGERVTITGIHLKTGTLTVGRDDVIRYKVYPVLPWVQAALEELSRLQRAVSALASKLGDVDVRVDYHRIDRSRPDGYQIAVDKLKAEILAAETKARELATS